jgi:hypothetical protein
MHEGGLDASKLVVFFSSLDIPPGACFIENNITFYKSLVKWNRLRFIIGY